MERLRSVIVHQTVKVLNGVGVGNSTEGKLRGKIFPATFKLQRIFIFLRLLGIKTYFLCSIVMQLCLPEF